MPMDQEAQDPMNVADVGFAFSDYTGSALSSPLLGNPQAGNPAKPSKVGGGGGAKLGDMAWWSEAPSRQSTGGSTAASTTGGTSPDISYLPRRLERLQEQRGWKYFFKHTMAVPLALAFGTMIGAASTSLFLRGLGAKPAAPPTSPTPVATGPMPYALAMPPLQVPVAYMMSPALNNSCLIPQITTPSGPQTFDACGFVIESTDAVWNARGDVDAAIEKYFHEDYVNAGSWGRRMIGKKVLRDAILSEMRAFPDIRIHITDCVCKGNDLNGYKCAMPDILTGTNMGPSGYGPATGKFARWTGLVQSLVKRNPKTGQWQYYAEWGVHDEWALIQQLGLDFTRVPRPAVNTEPLHDCTPLVSFGPEPQMDANDAAIQQAHVRAKALQYH
eukprot:CAMPEP_0204603992 /NCGR_PEP_ID=MMETSP0661-20131031/57585_1 /ASSEMBLY_ACC=CAM_ASM_000606 /TAXON_ID=109239 /ORGANISM="Alexandrium margalefi, Strain AMGDE01CS-322" /LENGTH=386 /DNA_ID=CAMNT_0051615105 /DNA_START=91 /DNA_END=1251 /DNA_ORIENTATION=-